jgi:hypothetical protein
MLQRLPHRLGLLTAGAVATALLGACGESNMAAEPTAHKASGGSPSTATGCLACAQSNCPSEANSCSSTQGCTELAACLLGCSVSGTGCGTQCSTNSNPNASGAAALYASCAILACPSACTPAAPGTGGSSGQTGTGGTTSGTGGQTTSSGGTTSAPTNLILDPNFNAVEAYWSATANGGDAATLSCSGGQCCVTNEYSTWFAFSLGYPRSSLQAFTVQGGATYTLSFRASGSSVNSLEAKVGKAVDPYTTIYSGLVTVASSMSTFTLQFTPSATDTTAGLVFNVELAEYGSICFSSVSLTKTP